MNEKYSDIIELPHPVSVKHPHMTIEERAAQFSPFAALNGYEDAIEETGRVTENEKILDEYELQILDEKLSIIKNKKVKAKITYFMPDENKDGGKYVTINGIVKKIDEYGQIIVMGEGEVIDIKKVKSIEIL